MSFSERDVFSTGEAVVRAWSNGATTGIPVLICNGLGAGPECWPGLYDDPTCGFQVVGFNHRGTAGSGRPYFDDHTYIEDHAADAIAVMTEYEMETAIVLGWSVGVSVAYQLALTAPDRVAGILAVAGLPDPTTGSIGHPLGVPSGVSQGVTSGAFAAARVIPQPILGLVNRLPVTDNTVRLLRHSGFLSTSADPDSVGAALTEYLKHDPQWYLQLAKSAGEHQVGDVAAVQCPALFLAGRNDIFLPLPLMSRSVSDIPTATLEIVDGGHFLPLERPDLIAGLLARFADAAGLGE
ncbi:alpha/beta hydrolase [Candidatus Nanopelagicales bacterium]|nr:alpha/beta hydrolase [Candidatus Nanopelagicales bacterium]